MRIGQISVILGNNAGRPSEFTKAMAAAGFAARVADVLAMVLEHGLSVQETF